MEAALEENKTKINQNESNKKIQKLDKAISQYKSYLTDANKLVKNSQEKYEQVLK